MTNTPWVHLVLKATEWEDLPHLVNQRIPADGVTAFLDGRRIESLAQFYREIGDTLPLISSFGTNLDALLDLFRTLGGGRHAGHHHVFVWYRPDIMLNRAPSDFRQVVDVILGASKELLVGEDLDPTFDSADQEDWISTRLDLVFITPDSGSVPELKAILAMLSDQWEFNSRAIPVSVEG